MTSWKICCFSGESRYCVPHCDVGHLVEVCLTMDSLPFSMLYSLLVKHQSEASVPSYSCLQQM
jgi:hypothetical protein